MSTGPWEITFTFTFTADEADDAHALRELLQTMAEAHRGITDVDVTASHPDTHAWVNTTGRPGAGYLLDLRTIP